MNDGTEDPRLEPEVAMRLLADEQRRRLLVALRAHDRWESGEAVATDAIVEDLSKRERLRMGHVHLPMFDDAGVVEWNHASDELSKGPRFEELVDVWRSVRERTSSVTDDED
jgi:hypothetical protein